MAVTELAVALQPWNKLALTALQIAGGLVVLVVSLVNASVSKDMVEKLPKSRSIDGGKDVLNFSETGGLITSGKRASQQSKASQ